MKILQAWLPVAEKRKLQVLRERGVYRVTAKIFKDFCGLMTNMVPNMDWRCRVRQPR
jgi:hypothetical protein